MLESVHCPWFWHGFELQAATPVAGPTGSGAGPTGGGGGLNPPDGHGGGGGIAFGSGTHVVPLIPGCSIVPWPQVTVAPVGPWLAGAVHVRVVGSQCRCHSLHFVSSAAGSTAGAGHGVLPPEGASHV